jgi:hypothetical protein
MPEKVTTTSTTPTPLCQMSSSFEIKFTPSMYRLIDEAFRERFSDLEQRLSDWIHTREEANKEVVHLENDEFTAFEKLFHGSSKNE